MSDSTVSYNARTDIALFHWPVFGDGFLGIDHWLYYTGQALPPRGSLSWFLQTLKTLSEEGRSGSWLKVSHDDRARSYWLKFPSYFVAGSQTQGLVHVVWLFWVLYMGHACFTIELWHQLHTEFWMEEWGCFRKNMFPPCTAQISLGEKVVTSLALNSELSRAENKGHRKHRQGTQSWKVTHILILSSLS